MNPLEDEREARPRSKWTRRALRAALAITLLAVLYGIGILIGPRIPAKRFEPSLKRALEQSLGRRVELGDVRLSLYPSPGLSAQNLVIYDEPEFGLEPLAYVDDIRVGLRWSALLRGRLECSSVRLLSASVNVSRSAGQEWNFAALLNRMGSGLAQGGPAPKIEVRDGRINFRDGVRKSPFFLNAVDLDVDAPGGAEGAYRWSYEASPARTDRSEQGFGRFSGTGSYAPAHGGMVDVDIELERSVISEVLVLFFGRDPGVQGRLSSRAHLAGPLSNIQIRGQLKLGDLERASIFNVRGRDWSVAYEGTFDVPGQRVSFKTVAPKDGEPLPVSIEASGESLLKQARWRSRFLLNGLPVESLLEMAGRLGVPVPRALGVEGTLNGEVAFATNEPARGGIELRDGVFRAGQAGPFKIAPVKMTLEETRLGLESATLTLANQGTAEITGSWELSDGTVELGATLKKAEWKELRPALAAFPAIGTPTGLDACVEGVLDGDVHFSRAAEKRDGVDENEGEPPSRFTGTLRVTALRCAVEGATDQIRVERGQLTLADPVWRLRRAAGRFGSLQWQGEAAREGLTQPVHFNVTLDALPLFEVQRVFQPTLEQRGSLIERTLKLKRAPLPEWLAARRWDGRIAAGKAMLAGYVLPRFAAHVVWNGAKVSVEELTARYEESTLVARGGVELGGGEPRYTARGSVEGLEWGENGKVNGEYELQATGFDDMLLNSLKVSAQVHARELEIGGETLEQAAGEIDYDAERSEQRLKLNALTGRIDGSPVTGAGGSAGDNRWRAEFTGVAHSFKLSGTFPPFRLEGDRSAGPRSR
jgi:hypothetical protein